MYIMMGNAHLMPSAGSYVRRLVHHMHKEEKGY